MMTLSYLIQKEFLQIRRNAFLPRVIVLFPIMVMCVMPWVMNMEIKNIRVEVVDADHSSLSSRLVHRIESSRYFIFCGQKASYAEAMTDVLGGTADAIVDIPHDFEKHMLRGHLPQIFVSANAVNGTKGSMALSYLSQIIGGHLGDFATQRSALTGTSVDGLVSTLYLYNKNLNYKVFMIPSLMAIIMLLICGFLPSLNIVGEKEAGTIEAINVTPVSKSAFILAKLIPYWLIALAVMTICFVLAWAIYGITCQGNILLCYLLSMLLALTFSGLGLIISNYNDTMQQAVFVMWFIVVNLILLSGLFTPVRSMPHWAYLTTCINPMHYFIDAIRTVFVRGGAFPCIAHQAGALTAFAMVVNVWAVLSYRKHG
jgi:ABC-2 type transport system permease protein